MISITFSLRSQARMPQITPHSSRLAVFSGIKFVFGKGWVGSTKYSHGMLGLEKAALRG